MRHLRSAIALSSLVALGSFGCSSSVSTADFEGTSGTPSDPGKGAGSSANGGTSGSTSGAGNIGVGGGQDFAAFRDALDHGQIPSPSTLDSTGFFAEHYTTLPAPTCGGAICLHGMLGISDDLVHGNGKLTLLQMGMSSPIDPATVQKPDLDVAVVLDHSGSMESLGKLDYAKQGVKLLIDGLGSNDTFTLIAFDDKVKTLFGPAKITDKAALKASVDALTADGGTNIYDALTAGYEKVLGAGTEQQQRRVIFLTDGLPSAGDTDTNDILKMSAGYNEKHVGLTAIGLGSDVDSHLLRSLSEVGGGNFYFVEKPEAVSEVFTEELAFFTAPLAYDVDLTYQSLPNYSLADHYGTNLWQPSSTGATVHIPSVFLTSRTSTNPGPNGGRRGGGAAIIASLAPVISTLAGSRELASLHLRYRLPGSTTYETQDAPISWDGTYTDGQYYSDPSVAKNSTMLEFYVAFREATDTAQKDHKAALGILTGFEPKAAARLAGSTDADLLDDLRILREYIAVLQKG
jgi:Ca-activated chloride channel family protein